MLREKAVINKKCYICNTHFTRLHFFYDSMCMECADLNYIKRNQTCNLNNKIALCTGGRIKIGYYIALLLLRNGALTIVTTRFPKDAALKFAKEPDFEQWADILHIYGLDFKYVPSIYEFCDFLKSKYPRLDIIINNAAQTIRREPSFNEPTIQKELTIDITTEPHLLRILPQDFQNRKLDQLLKSQGILP